MQLCKCGCGSEVRRDFLRGHNTYVIVPSKYGRKVTGTPEHTAWCNMIDRCINPNHPQFKDWGGRGIEVCDEWRSSFEAFYTHIGPRPTPHHTLDRIDNDGNYEPGNVRWATRKEQAANRRPDAHPAETSRKKSVALKGRKQSPEAVCNMKEARWPNH